MVNQTKEDTIKTIYLGFHDGKEGVRPHIQYEIEPVRLNISHFQAIRIIGLINMELKRIVREEIKEIRSNNYSDNGAWPT